MGWLEGLLLGRVEPLSSFLFLMEFVCDVVCGIYKLDYEFSSVLVEVVVCRGVLLSFDCHVMFARCVFCSQSCRFLDFRFDVMIFF